MNILFPAVRLAVLGALLISSTVSQAAITLSGTRLIFSAPSKEASILVKNNAAQDIMIQSWIDPDEASSNKDTPFAITPSLSRLGGNKQQLLRVFYQGKGAEQNRESVYWLSIQEIPPKSEADNTLQIAVRQKIKVFYRPQGLTGSAADAPKELKWRVTANGVEATNTSAFHVSISKLRLISGNTTYIGASGMIPPGKTTSFSVKDWKGKTASKTTIEFDSVNDYGGLDKHTATPH